MQEQIQKDIHNKVQIIQPLTNVKQILSNTQSFRCQANNSSTLVCFSQKCQKPGLCCDSKTCQCRKKHKKCYYIDLQRIIQSIINKQHQITQQTKESYQILIKNINQMIQQLSQLRNNIQLQMEFFGLDNNQIKFVEFVRDNKINEISGKLIDSMKDTLDQKKQYKMFQKNDILKDFKIKRQRFSKLCQQISFKYSKKQKSYFNSKNNFISDSVILTYQMNQDKELLMKWIREIPKYQNANKIKTRLLFKASDHNFQASSFHNYCDGKSNTLVLVKTQFDTILGGYANNPWLSQRDNYSKDQTKSSFIFSLYAKIKIKCSNYDHSTRNLVNWGPYFGDADLYIQNKANISTNTGFFPANAYKISQNNPSYPENQSTYTMLSGNPKSFIFKAKQYEVFQILS